MERIAETAILPNTRCTSDRKPVEVQKWEKHPTKMHQINSYDFYLILKFSDWTSDKCLSNFMPNPRQPSPGQQCRLTSSNFWRFHIQLGGDVPIHHIFAYGILWNPVLWARPDALASMTWLVERCLALWPKNTFRSIPKQYTHYTCKPGRNPFLPKRCSSISVQPSFFVKPWLFSMVLVKSTKKKGLKKKQDEAHEPECRHVCWQRETILICHISSKLTCETPWVHTLRWHSCRTPLLDTIAQRSGETLLLDTLVRHSCKTLLTWHSCKTLSLDTLLGHSYLTLLPDTLLRHSYMTLLLDALTWRFLLDTLLRHSCKMLLLDTLVGHSYLTLL